MTFEIDEPASKNETELYAEICDSLPNTCSFRALRLGGKIYVDKTELLYPIACCRFGAYYLARPPRFGKSTLLSTLEELFEHGVEPYDDHDSCFKGLDIERLWTEPSGLYQVLRLDFSLDFNRNKASATDFAKQLGCRIKQFAKALNIELPQDCGTSLDTLLSALLNEVKDSSIVLLIDDFDTPLLCLAGKPEELHILQELLRSFYALIKHFSSKFRLIFITGLTRCKDYLTWNSGNFITDISTYPRYAELCGFTLAELNQNFRLCLIYQAMHQCSTSKDYEKYISDLLNGLNLWYGGYTFGDNAYNKVLSTGSVLKFFKKAEADFPVNLSIDPGFEAVLKEKFLLSDLPSLTEHLNYNTVLRSYFSFASGANTVEQLTLLELLYCLGFLTLHEPVSSVSSCAAFRIANKEMMMLLSNTAANYVMGGYQDQPGLLNLHRDVFLDALNDSDADAVSDCLTTVLRTINRSRKDLCSKKQISSILYRFMSAFDLNFNLQNRSLLATNSDLTFIINPLCSVLLIKFFICRTNDKDKLDLRLTKAIEEIREASLPTLAIPFAKVLRLALVYSVAEQAFVRSSLLEDPSPFSPAFQYLPQ